MTGLNPEWQVCDSCQGSGGAKCFACDGTGKMRVSRDDVYKMSNAASGERDFFGRENNPRQCIACKGVGIIYCPKCRGSGYTKRL